jgi:hypothetical protein
VGSSGLIAVLVPALDRPDRVRPLAESLCAASASDPRLLYLTSPHDDATREACRAAGVSYVTTPFELAAGDYARKVNYGVTLTEEPWVFQAGDDIAFHPRWDEIILQYAQQHDAARVIGTNDLGNPLVKAGAHSTHSLIARSYIQEQGTIDEPGKALHEGYWHCWVDNELIETAKARRVYFAARRCRVEHLHHIWRGDDRKPKSRNDATYERGQRQYHEDHALFVERRPLWRGGNVRRKTA